MATSEGEQVAVGEPPLIVRTHVTPWGFLVALPLALAFAFVGAWSLDAGLVPAQLGLYEDAPIWLYSALLLGFALFLFLVGVGELASFLKPAVEVVLDEDGVTVFSLVGERRLKWPDVAGAALEPGQLVLRGRGDRRRAGPVLRMHFNRLDIDPLALVGRVGRHRPDLMSA